MERWARRRRRPTAAALTATRGGVGAAPAAGNGSGGGDAAGTPAGASARGREVAWRPAQPRIGIAALPASAQGRWGGGGASHGPGGAARVLASMRNDQSGKDMMRRGAAHATTTQLFSIVRMVFRAYWLPTSDQELMGWCITYVSADLALCARPLGDPLCHKFPKSLRRPTKVSKAACVPCTSARSPPHE